MAQAWLCAGALALAFAGGAFAQAPLEQNTPLSAWLDLRPATPASQPQVVPAWVEEFEYVPAKPAVAQGRLRTMEFGAQGEALTSAGPDNTADAGDDGRARSIFRIRLQRPAAAKLGDLQVRLFFDDRVGGPRPRIGAWNELGNETMRSAPLGQGLGLPSSETVNVPMDGVNYLEIDAAEDGTQVRAVFLSWLDSKQVRQPADFPLSAKVSEPFHVLPFRHASGTDTYLYGVVTATLQKAPLMLGAQGASLEFELDRAPLMAILTYEVLGADIAKPPAVTVNGQAAGTSTLYLPDLADPAYQGNARESQQHMDFRYTGWLRAQTVIPGGGLTVGVNTVTLELSDSSDSLAVRSVKVQLKYNWEKLDYVLTPAAGSKTQ